MKIKCKCGNVVVEGEIVIRENNRGNRHKAFDIDGKPNGTIIKNKSNDPDDWTGICPSCQKKESKK